MGDLISWVPKLLPSTYRLAGIRLLLIGGRGFAEVRGQFFALLFFLAVLLPISLWSFAAAVRRAKREGSLVQY